MTNGPILALDASVRAASAALLDADGGLLGRWQQQTGTMGTAELAPAVAGLLEASGVTAHDLGGVAVGIGPGSYTGLRAGIAFARAITHATGCPLAGVASVAAAALHVLDDDPDLASVIVLIDARRDEHYRADYARPADAAALLDEWCAPRLIATDVSTALSVPGAQPAAHHDESRVSIVREPVPDAYDVGRLGRLKLAAGGDDPATVLPLYLKRSHAEIALEERSR